MEPWRRELYHSELYHYGVKGMKWGEHKFGDILKDWYDRRITGKKQLASQHRANLTRAHLVRKRNDYLKQPFVKKIMDSGKSNDNLVEGHTHRLQGAVKSVARKDHISARKAEDRAAAAYGKYKKQSLKGITEHHIQKAKKWFAGLRNRKINSKLVDGEITRPDSYKSEVYKRRVKKGIKRR